MWKCKYCSHVNEHRDLTCPHCGGTRWDDAEGTEPAPEDWAADRLEKFYTRWIAFFNYIADVYDEL